MDDKFWKATKIWSLKPHVINKRLSGIATVSSWKFSSNVSSWTDYVEKASHLHGLDEDDVLKQLESWNVEPGNHWGDDFPHHDPKMCFLSLRKCFPKQNQRYQPVLELEILDFKMNSAIYIPLKHKTQGSDHLLPPCAYVVLLKNNNVELDIHNGEESGKWIIDNILPKLRKWFGEMDENESTNTESLRLVSFAAYNELYQQLKEKYVKDITTIWPECTDPQKFIHEDVAIATYLILLWRQERLELNLDVNYRQSFFDIGCGNGLLVYLLTSEGHPGKGIDIRARKIWSFYPSEIKLEVSTLVPSETTCFPEFDWLLGNHSDELTPWLPVMALQSSVRRQPEQLPTRYWVLPCCPFSFWGKFQREKFNPSSQSRYAEFLRFVDHVGQTCGFQVYEDRMRIPSTRRTCFVGKAPNRSSQEWDKILLAKTNLIASGDAEKKILFQPRSALEPVKNCTRVERTILDQIVELTAKYLLAAGISVEGAWNPGGTIVLSDLVQMMSREFSEFHRLKSECGGIQTLLKNHSHIFVVQNKSVRLRSPEELSVDEWRSSLKPRKKMKVDNTGSREKKKPCWFHLHHPDGCPLDQEACRYLHEIKFINVV